MERRITFSEPQTASSRSTHPTAPSWASRKPPARTLILLPLDHLRISARRLRHIYGPSDSVLFIPRHPALGVREHLRLSVRRRTEMSRTTNEHSSTCLPTLTKKRRNLSLDSSAS